MLKINSIQSLLNNMKRKAKRPKKKLKEKYKSKNLLKIY